MKYLHIGGNEVVPHGEIVGIFDLDSCTSGKIGAEFLAKSEKKGIVKNVSEEIPRTFILCAKKCKKRIKKLKNKTIYLTQISSIALRERVKLDII